MNIERSCPSRMLGAIPRPKIRLEVRSIAALFLATAVIYIAGCARNQPVQKSESPAAIEAPAPQLPQESSPVGRAFADRATVAGRQWSRTLEQRISGLLDCWARWRVVRTLPACGHSTCTKGAQGSGALRGPNERRPRLAHDEIDLCISGSHRQSAALRRPHSAYSKDA